MRQIREEEVTMPAPRKIAHRDWCHEGEKLYGNDTGEWKFVCPLCGHVAAKKEWDAAGAPGAAGFSCIGRYLDGKCRSAFYEKGPGPCDYAGGGLFQLNPVEITMDDGSVVTAFEFAANVEGLAS